MLNSVGTRTQPSLTLLVTGRLRRVHCCAVGTRAIMPSWNWGTTAMNLVGQPNFSWLSRVPPDWLYQRPWLDQRRSYWSHDAVPCISLGASRRQRSCQWSLDLRGSRTGSQGGDLAPGGRANDWGGHGPESCLLKTEGIFFGGCRRAGGFLCACRCEQLQRP